MATLTPVAPKREATVFAETGAAAGGDVFANDGRRFLVIENTGVGSVTLTITTNITVDGEPVDDKEITLGAGERHLIGPFPGSIYNDQDGNVNLAYSDETDVKVAVIDAS